MQLTVFVMAYGTVLLAELIGDKAIYTIITLATRYGTLPVLCGTLVAFMGKMLAAVLVGRGIAELPPALVAAMSATTFLTMALVIWLKRPERKPLTIETSPYWSRAALISFAAIFFSEWGDLGQIAAATTAARYHAPVIVWCGATLAMVTKGTLAITLGTGLRRRVPDQVLRYGALGVCVVMGILSVLKIDI